MQQSVTNFDPSPYKPILICKLVKYLKIHQKYFTQPLTRTPTLAEELRGFESRCCRLQSSLDRVQNDRLVFLKNVGSIINVAEPCESLIKDKVREIMNENQTMHNVS